MIITIRLKPPAFPKEAEEYDDLLALYRPVKIRGSTSFRNNETTIRVDRVENPVSVGV